MARTKPRTPSPVDIQNLCALSNWRPPEGVEHTLEWNPATGQLVVNLGYQGAMTYASVYGKPLEPVAFDVLTTAAQGMKDAVDAGQVETPDDLREAIAAATDHPVHNGPPHVLPVKAMGKDQ
jgi:hypothetical protein